MDRPTPSDLRLLEARTFGNGVVLLRHERLGNQGCFCAVLPVARLCAMERKRVRPRAWNCRTWSRPVQGDYLRGFDRATVGCEH
jgi:hypothetical protein